MRKAQDDTPIILKPYTPKGPLKTTPVGGFQKTTIARLARLYIPLLGGRKFTFGEGCEWLDIALKKVLENKPMHGTAVVGDLFKALFYEEENLQRAVDAWPKAMRMVIEEALENYFVSTDYIDDAIAAHPATFENLSGTEVQLNSSFLKSVLTPNESMKGTELSIGRLVHQHLAKFLELPSFSESVATTDVLPEGNLEVLNYEKSTVQSLDSFDLTRKVNGISLTSGLAYVVKEGDLSTLASACAWDEPYAQSPDKAMKKYRARMIAFWLLNTYERNYKLSREEEFGGSKSYRILESLRADLHGGYVDVARLAACAMPFMSRFTKKTFGDIYGNDLMPVVCTVMSKYTLTSSEGDASLPWLDFDDVVSEILAKMSYNYRLILEAGMVDGAKWRNECSKSLVNLNNVMAEFTRPFIKSVIVSLGMLGAVEMVRDKARGAVHSPFDNIRYVRLTTLGRFLLGRKTSYEFEPTELSEPNLSPIELSDDSLMIIARRPESLDFLKTNIGTKVTSTRFIVDEDSIMRGVKFPYELKNKKKMLTQLARLPKLPRIWENFFDNLNRKFTALTAVDSSPWNMYSVDPASTDIVKLLTEDPEIRPLITLVEGGRFLVERGPNDAKLRGLLMAHGVTLPSPYRRLGYSGGF